MPARVLPGVDGLAECTEDLLAPKAAPINCVPIMIRSKSDEDWMVAIIDLGRGPFYSTAPSFELIFVFADDLTVRPFDALISALEEQPLLLEIEKWPDPILAVSFQKPSRIFPGWREWVSVLIHVDDYCVAPSDDLACYEIEVFLAIYVNKQATARPTDWHMPTESQTKRYIASLKKTVFRALDTLCRDSGRTVTRLDSESVVCR